MHSVHQLYLLYFDVTLLIMKMIDLKQTYVVQCMSYRVVGSSDLHGQFPRILQLGCKIHHLPQRIRWRQESGAETTKIQVVLLGAL